MVGFQGNLQTNSTRKSEKYILLIHTLQATYTEVKFLNVSMSALGALDNSCDSLLSMLNDIDTP